MTRHLATFGLCLTAAVAQTAVEVPRAGCLRSADGALRPVHGIGGAFLAGAPVASGVVSAACSDSLAIVKTDEAVEVRDGSLRLLARWDAPPGAALFALAGGGRAAFAYFPGTGELVRVDVQSPPRAVPDSQSLGGSVLAIASPDPLHLLAVVEDVAGPRLVRISTADGLIESESPLGDSASPSRGTRPALVRLRPRTIGRPLALLADGTLVFADGEDLVIRRPDGTEQRTTLPATVTAIEQMGNSWLVLRLAGAGAPLALRLQDGREQLCHVPVSEPAP
jgi:hypothetical protein